MPNEDLQEALKEVYALAPSGCVPLDTLEISHPSLSDRLFMVQDTQSHEMTLENGDVFTFEPVPFRFIPPGSGKNGFQDMTIALDNVDRRIGQFVEAIGTESKAPVVVTYRPYLSNDLSGPQSNTPLVLYLKDIKVDIFQVTGRAVFNGIINMNYPNEFYLRSRFPGLGG